MRSRASYLAGSLLVFLTFLFSACGRKLDYSAAFTSDSRDCQSFEGEEAELTLRLKNKGTMEWRSEGKAPCFLSYHLLDAEGKIVRFDNLRTSLPGVVRPGDSVTLSIKVKAPLVEGKYFVEFDLVREGVAWFKDYGSKTLLLPFLVQKRVWPEDEHPVELEEAKSTAFRSSLPELETLHKLIRITLKHNETEFQGKSGRVYAFTAGKGYPQVWLRDAATILPASRYYYPESFLSSWVEEHLAWQEEDGGLFDWLDSQGQVDKNTVETDQEASAIQAAYQVFLLRGADWLNKKIYGQPVIDRLEKALLFVFENRFDRKFGLVTGDHTADWGDVDIVDSDRRAIYVDENTHWTVDIYDQSMCFQSCIELARMLEAAGKKEKASAWRARAEALKKNTDRWLWQEERGFYRVHLHLDSLAHDFEEEAMFPMGGNAQAILSGLAGSEKAAKIIREAIKRQREFKISTVSASLLPPYPAGFFKHPAMDEPYEYQNGGQWDWFGGRLVYSMFEHGFSRLGREKLLEIVHKNIANGSLYEWDTPEGEGRGSDYYAGSAGSLARALFEGYFGVRLEEKSLTLSPRLGEDQATIRFYFPAVDIFLAYDYRLDFNQRKIIFRCNSNIPYSGQVRILVPWDFFGLADRIQDRSKLLIQSNGQPVFPEWLTVQEDDYIIIRSDFRNHLLEISKSK